MFETTNKHILSKMLKSLRNSWDDPQSWKTTDVLPHRFDDEMTHRLSCMGGFPGVQAGRRYKMSVKGSEHG